MANRPETNDVSTGAQYSPSTLNEKFHILEDAIENCLGRGGTAESPNSMQGDLDLNLNRIINVDSPINKKDAVNKEYLDAIINMNSSNFVIRREENVLATEGQTVFVTTTPFVPGAGGPAVYVNGVRQTRNLAYSETSAATITFSEGLRLGDEVTFVFGDIDAGSGEGGGSAASIFYDSRAYASLDEAVDSLGGAVLTLVVPSPIPASDDLAVPTNINIEIINNGSITVASGKTLTINGGFKAPRQTVFLGAGSVVFGVGSTETVYPEWWSSTGGIKQAVEAAASNSIVSLAANKIYTETAPITRNSSFRNTHIKGVSSDRQNVKGTQINFAFTSAALFELGTDVGAWDANLYDGVQGFVLEDVLIMFTGALTPLSNGLGSYGVGSIGLRDWKGGHIKLHRVRFENCEYGFHGVQSDINDFDNVEAVYCKKGFYIGPRSDQFSLAKLYAYGCDQAVIVDGAAARITNPQVVGCGYQNLYPIEILQTSASSRVTHIQNPWFEDYQGSGYVTAFIGVGVNAGYGGASSSPNVVITYPQYLTAAQGGSNYTKYLVEINRGFVTLNDPVGDFTNIEKLVSFIGNATNVTGGCFIEGRSFLASKAYVNNGTGTPDIYMRLWGQGSHTYHGNSNMHIFRKEPSNVNQAFAMSMSTNDRWELSYIDNPTDFKSALYLNRRRYIGLVASPGGTPSGPFTLRRGESFTVTTPVSGQPWEYVCTASGTYGDYAALENRTATTVAGNTTVTLSAATTKLYKDQYIRIAGAGVAAGNLDTTIVSVASDGLTIVVADAPTTPNSGLAISFRAPTTSNTGALS